VVFKCSLSGDMTYPPPPSYKFALDVPTAVALFSEITCRNTVQLRSTQCEFQRGHQPHNSKVLLERNVDVELTHGDKIGNVGRALGCNLDF